MPETILSLHLNYPLPPSEMISAIPQPDLRRLDWYRRCSQQVACDYNQALIINLLSTAHIWKKESWTKVGDFENKAADVGLWGDGLIKK
jgi:hypothetical protein